MANALKGERVETIGDDDFTLVFDVNALCEVEDVIGRPTGEAVHLIGTGDMKLLRAFMWGALRRHHPDVTLGEAGDLVGQLTPVATQSALIDCMAKAFPKPDAKGAGKAKASPPKAAKTSPPGTSSGS